MMINGSLIKQLRKKQKLSQTELAQMVGCSRSAVYDWERGKYEPEGKNLVNLAAVLGVSVGYLIGEITGGVYVQEAPPEGTMSEEAFVVSDVHGSSAPIEQGEKKMVRLGDGTSALRETKMFRLGDGTLHEMFKDEDGEWTDEKYEKAKWECARAEADYENARAYSKIIDVCAPLCDIDYMRTLYPETREQILSRLLRTAEAVENIMSILGWNKGGTNKK